MDNYFIFSKLKKHIEMMNKEKTQPVYKIKRLLPSLIVAVILLSFNMKRAIATTVYFAVDSEISESKQIIESDTVENKLPAAIKITVTDSLRHSINKSPLIIVDGKKLSKDKLSKLNIDSIRTLKILKRGIDSQTNVEQSDNSVSVIFAATEDNENEDTPKSEISTSESLIIIDDEKKSDEEYLNLDTKDIESLTILKNDAATKQYGEKGKNGVIMIKTKKSVD
jgi:TonB-dependent SusC/RagA subfamily outer membrane receptor